MKQKEKIKWGLNGTGVQLLPRGWVFKSHHRSE